MPACRPEGQPNRSPCRPTSAPPAAPGRECFRQTPHQLELSVDLSPCARSWICAMPIFAERSSLWPPPSGQHQRLCWTAALTQVPEQRRGRTPPSSDHFRLMISAWSFPLHDLEVTVDGPGALHAPFLDQSAREQLALWRSKLAHTLSRGAKTVQVARAPIPSQSRALYENVPNGPFADVRAAIYSYELPSSSSPVSA